MKNELEQKYYDLATDFVKNHRKFESCADFLEEIVEDVMDRSKSIIENVNDESVISSYIQKMVSNSIITISKQHNINTRPRRELLTPVQKEQNIHAEESAPVIQAEINESVEDNDIQKAESLAVEDINIKEEEVAVTENLEVGNTDNIELEINEDNKAEIIENLDIENVDNLEIIEMDAPITELSEQESSDGMLNEVAESNSEFHQNYVDEMINGMEPESPEVLAEPIELSENLDEISVLDESGMIVELDSSDNVTEYGLSENINQEELLIESVENESLLQPEEIEETDTLVDDNEIVPLEEGADLLSEELNSEEGMLLQEPEDSITEDLVQPVKENALNKIYEIFSYTPDIKQADDNFEGKENELKILSEEDLNVLYLKYKKNLSISEIATQTEKEISEVIDILNTAIDLIKD